MKRHELQIVLVRANAEMRDAFQRRLGRPGVGDEHFRSGLMQFHSQFLIFGKLAAATACPTRRLFSSGT